MSKESNQQYHADLSRVSNSMLTVLKRSPKEFKSRFIDQDWGPEDQKSFRIGNMVHCMVLEPVEFDSRYIVAEKHDRRTNVGKAAWAEFELRAEGLEIMAPDEVDIARACTVNLLRHDEIRPIMSSLPLDAETEERIDFRMSDVDCRCKPDLLLPSAGLIIDVKTTQDASPEAFARSVAKFGYARQNAFYCEGARQKYGVDFRFVFAVVSTSKPFETACYELSPLTLEIANTEVRALLDDYRRRMERNDWEAPWSRGVVPMDLPRYYNANVFVEDEDSVEEEVAA